MKKTDETQLETLTSIWQLGVNHPTYSKWHESAVSNYEFYAGKQWDHDDARMMRERGQKPLTLNMLQSQISSICGVEIHSQYHVGCEIDLEDKEDSKTSINLSYRQISKALTHLLLTWQKNERVLQQGSWKFKDAMITGLSWSSVYIDKSGVIRYKWCNPLNIVPDFNDTDPQFCNMQYVLRRWYMTPEEIVSTWGDRARGLDLKDKKFYDRAGGGSHSGELFGAGPYGERHGYNTSTPMVKEVQYKVSKTAYAGLTKNGMYFQTFNEERAEDICDNKNEIEEFPSHQIMRGYFVDGTLLELEPLTPDFPGQQDFSYIPFVWDKNTIDARPISFVDTLKGVQQDINIRMSSASYYSRSNQVVVQGGLLAGMTKDDMRRELNNKNGLIHVPTGTNVTFNPSTNVANQQMDVGMKYVGFLERMSGVNQEMQGFETNATSGRAQEIRQINSIRNHTYKFAGFLGTMKEREARVAISLFQNAALTNYYVCCLDDGEKESFILNLEGKDRNGETVIHNDISNLPVNIEFKELKGGAVGNNAQRREDAMLIAQNLHLINFPTLLKDLGFTDPERYLEDINRQKAEAMEAQQPLEAQATAIGEQAIPEGVM